MTLGLKEKGGARKFFSQVIEKCEVIGKDVVNNSFSTTKNRLMTQLTCDWGLRLRRVQQRAWFRVMILETPPARVVDSD